MDGVDQPGPGLGVDDGFDQRKRPIGAIGQQRTDMTRGAAVPNEGDGSMWVVDPPVGTKKKAHAARKHRKTRRHRAHRRHHRRAARSAQASNIALLRARAHSLPLVPPVD